MGKLARVLIDQFYTYGRYQVNLDASQLPGGVYGYRMTTPHFTASRKMIIVK